MEIYHKIGAIIIRNHHLLVCKKKEEPHYIMPGGKLEAGETHKQCLERELREELHVSMAGMRFFDSYEAPHFQNPDITINMDVYSVEIAGEPKPSSEIEQIAWITSSSYKINGLHLGSIVEKSIIPELKKRRMII